MCSDTLHPGGEERGCSAGCTIAMSDVSPFVWVQLARPYREFPLKKLLFDMGGVRCGGIISCFDWHKIVLLFPLHIACNFESYAAHRTPPISAVCCQKRQQHRRHLARSSTVHVESTDTMRSRKAQCQAPPDRPETGNAYMYIYSGVYHRRGSGRSCAGEKIEHQNEHKRRSSSSAGMHVYKRG